MRSAARSTPRSSARSKPAADPSSSERQDQLWSKAYIEGRRCIREADALEAECLKRAIDQIAKDMPRGPDPRRLVTSPMAFFSLPSATASPVPSWMGVPVRIDPSLDDDEWFLENPETGERVSPR